MRLSPLEIESIISVFSSFIKEQRAELFLYGSRVDDIKKGGDIDLALVLYNSNLVLELSKHRYQILSSLKNAIGDQKIDLQIIFNDDIALDPFMTFALKTAISLKKWR